VTELQTELAAANSELLYRELDLDKIRMQYEMEIHAQIGTGNTQVARALLRQVRAKYQLAMVWIEIDQLRGEIK
jgi:Ni2+-binding GTPase involved in maturation of urease and hydrogenase